MRQLFPKLTLCQSQKHHALVFVRLAHDRRLVAAVLFVLFVFVVHVAPREVSHSFMREAVSNWRALRTRRSRSMPGGVP